MTSWNQEKNSKGCTLEDSHLPTWNSKARLWRDPACKSCIVRRITIIMRSVISFMSVSTCTWRGPWEVYSSHPQIRLGLLFVIISQIYHIVQNQPFTLVFLKYLTVTLQCLQHTILQWSHRFLLVRKFKEFFWVRMDISEIIYKIASILASYLISYTGFWEVCNKVYLMKYS